MKRTMDVLKNSENTLTIFVPKISFSRKFRQVCVFSASTIVDRYRGQKREVKPPRMRSNLEVMLLVRSEVLLTPSQACPGSMMGKLRKVY